MKTGQIHQLMPALCHSVSLPSETKSKASPRGLSCSEHGFTIVNYPKIISVPSSAEFTSAVFAGGLIAAALAALQNKSWEGSKLLIATIIQQGVTNLQPNTQETLLDLAESAISQHRPLLGRKSRQTRSDIQRMWARQGLGWHWVKQQCTELTILASGGTIQGWTGASSSFHTLAWCLTVPGCNIQLIPWYPLPHCQEIALVPISRTLHSKEMLQDSPSIPPLPLMDHTSHMGKCGDIWGEKIPRGLMLLQSTGLAFQIKASGSILYILPDCEERRSFVSSRKISHLQRPPTASPSLSWREQAANTALLTEPGLDQRKAEIHGIAGGPGHHLCCHPPLVLWDFQAHGNVVRALGPEAQMKHQKLHSSEWDRAENLSSFLMRFPFSLLVLFGLETPWE